MYRLALRGSSSSRYKQRPPCRSFHATLRCRSDQYRPIVDDLSSNAHAFHSFFQYVHEFTTLPWLITIPLTTLLLRAPITFLRFYLGPIRRDQRLAAPELALAAKFVQTQSDAKVAADHITLEESERWKTGVFSEWRNRIMKRHKRAAPSMLLNPHDNVDITNMLSLALSMVNISTLLALSYSDPVMFGPDNMEIPGSYLSGCFILLAWHNSNYYCGYPHWDISQKESYKFHPVTWSPRRTDVLVAASPPLLVAWTFGLGPGAVLVFLLSNSIITFTEIKVINRIFDMPPVIDRHQRYTMQKTRNSKKDLF